MFIILGIDGKEYGPASADQIAQWIRDGRANIQSKARRADGGGWQTLADFPEFAAATQPVRAAASARPPVDAKVYAEALIARGGQLDIGSCISRSWHLLTSDYWPIVGATFVLGVVSILVCAIPLAALLLKGVFLGGLYLYYLKRVRGERATLGDMFSGFSLAFLPLLLATLVSSVLTTIGLVLLIIPGIYLAVAWAFTYPLVIDQKLEFWDAMEVSRRVITRQWWRMLLLVIVAGFLGSLGIIVLGIGVFLTQPILWGAIAYAYTDLCAPLPAPVAAPAPAVAPAPAAPPA